MAKGLARALAVADLAGRYDAQAGRGGVAALAGADRERPSAAHLRLPDREAIAFFLGKLNVPTETWTDIWQEHHDVAFVVAGAARDDLLSDLRAAVEDTRTAGEGLEGFRKRFDAVVARRGWSYKGGRNWRTRTIWHTNLRQSYNAGRYQQMKGMAADAPFWRYRHSDVSEDPRRQHLAWDGLVLRHDDPWWDTHSPMNGWGCNCFVEALSERELKRIGKTGPDDAPPDHVRKVTVGKGPAARVVAAPEGVDPGFGYAPGREAALGRAARDRVRKALAQEPVIAARGIAGALSNPRALAALSAEWRRWRALRSKRRAAGEAFEVGALSPAVLAALRQKGLAPATAQIAIWDAQLAHVEDKGGRAAALTGADLDRLPEILARPKAVLFDEQGAAKGAPELVFAFAPAAGGREAGKVTIWANFTRDARKDGATRARLTANAVRSAGYLRWDNLRRNRRYVVLDGALEE